MLMPNHSPIVQESKDGVGAADHDKPYTFGRRPTVTNPQPFTLQQYAHLLVLRSRVQEGRWLSTLLLP